MQEVVPAPESELSIKFVNCCLCLYENLSVASIWVKIELLLNYKKKLGYISTS